MESILHEPSKERILQIYKYLQALDHLKNPVIRDIQLQPWRFWFKDLPRYETITLGNVAKPEESDAPFVLKIKRPVLTDAPTLPTKYLPLLKDTWKRPEQKVRINMAKLPKKKNKIAQEITEQGLLEDYLKDPEFGQWYEARALWAEMELPVRKAMNVYNEIFELYARLERESEQFELILSDGILHWEHATGLLHHPILLQRLKLEFNPSVPEFVFLEAEHPVELYSALFRSISEVNGTVLAHFQEELEEKPFYSLGGQATAEYFQRIVTQLSPYGQFLKPGEKPTHEGGPTLVRDPLIFLRKRSLGFSKALEEILNDIPERTDLPGFLKNIVGIESDSQTTTQEALRVIDPNGEDEQILLSKPANEEQLQIAARLNRSDAVLVQGPPGTGKTHSIANLIGHLLAQGKSVLVTSHTSKALSVLHEKIVEPLQPLCLSVLSEDSRTQLERSIDAITERLAGSEPEILKREALKLQEERLHILKKLRQTRRELLEARADEYRPIVIAGKRYTPAEAARKIQADMETCQWLPGPVRLGVPLPFSAQELHDLYRTNVSLNREDEKELSGDLPDLQRLPVPQAFQQLVDQYQTLLKTDLNLGIKYWDPRKSVGKDVLEQHLKELIDAIQVLHNADKWQLALIQIGTYPEEHRKPWLNLLTQIEEVFAMSTEAQESLLEFHPQVSKDCLPKEISAVLEEIISHLKSGGSLTLLKLLTKRNWKTVINESRINGEPPEQLEHFLALKALVDLRNAREKLLTRWERQVTVLGGPSLAELGQEPEFGCQKYEPFIREALGWLQNHWRPLIQRLEALGFLWQDFYDQTPVKLGSHWELERLKNAVQKELTQIIASQVNRIKVAEIQDKLVILRSQFEQTAGTESQVAKALKKALQELDTNSYAKAYHRLQELKGLSQDFRLRQEYLARLSKVAPTWAKLLQNREGIHGEGKSPKNPRETWLWRQFIEELDARGKQSFQELMNQITHLSTKLQEKTALLVEKKAWEAQVRRTTVPQRLALNGWKQLMRRIGKGTGKRVPELLAEARKLMPMCQSAVPVWIMPLSRVVENFNPRTNQFDVVIIDEASQADVLALTALYMGKQVVIVGDNEQVSPSAVGQKTEDTDRLIDEHLQGIPNRKLYDGLFSIYDLAGTAFQPICLKEHFRCVTPIIQFSNDLSYEGKIRPLRDDSTVKVRPHMVAYQVEGGMSKKKTNEEEAKVIASLVMACTEMPEYKDASIGVISLVGEEQAAMIDRLLQQNISAEEYKRRRIQCGNPAQFQGDERDVIFLSMVDGSSGNGQLNRRSEGANDTFKKRFNVAASRARDQMWVVYSMDPENDLKPGDIRQALIKHAQDPQATIKMLDTVEKQTESEFEKLVADRLRQERYKVHPQWKVGSYPIDMVVEGKGQRVALECDGDKWHTPDRLAEDMSRQAILERLGWRFIRVRGSEFFRDPEKTMAKIIERLTYYDVFPEKVEGEESLLVPPSEELKTQVIGRAVAIRKLWDGEEEVEDDEIIEEVMEEEAIGLVKKATHGKATDTVAVQATREVEKVEAEFTVKVDSVAAAKAVEAIAASAAEEVAVALAEEVDEFVEAVPVSALKLVPAVKKEKPKANPKDRQLVIIYEPEDIFYYSRDIIQQYFNELDVTKLSFKNIAISMRGLINLADCERVDRFLYHLSDTYLGKLTQSDLQETLTLLTTYLKVQKEEELFSAAGIFYFLGKIYQKGWSALLEDFIKINHAYLEDINFQIDESGFDFSHPLTLLKIYFELELHLEGKQWFEVVLNSIVLTEDLEMQDSLEFLYMGLVYQQEEEVLSFITSNKERFLSKVTPEIRAYQLFQKAIKDKHITKESLQKLNSFEKEAKTIQRKISSKAFEAMNQRLKDFLQEQEQEEPKQVLSSNEKQSQLPKSKPKQRQRQIEKQKQKQNRKPQNPRMAIQPTKLEVKELLPEKVK